MKKLLPYILIFIALVGLFSPIVSIYATPQVGPCQENYVQDPNGAGCVPVATDTNYHLLAPLPGVSPTFNPTDKSALGIYLNLMIKLFIGICAVLAVIMIVMGGIEYMTSELISNKEHGKEKITGAIFGLILALGAWLILSTINPDILKTNLSSLKDVTVEVDLNDSVPQTPVNGKYKDGSIFGAPWDDTVGKIMDLPPYISVYNSQCTTVGQSNCTSTRGLDVSAVKTIQWGCKCNIQISGGTEFWAHGGTTGSTSHQLNSSTVDLLPTSELNQYLSGGKPLVNNQRYPPPSGPLYETKGGTHWHIGP